MKRCIVELLRGVLVWARSFILCFFQSHDVKSKVLAWKFERVEWIEGEKFKMSEYATFSGALILGVVSSFVKDVLFQKMRHAYPK